MALKQRLVLRMRHLPFTDLLADGEVIPGENIWDEVGSPPPRIMHVVLRPRTNDKAVIEHDHEAVTRILPGACTADSSSSSSWFFRDVFSLGQIPS